MQQNTKRGRTYAPVVANSIVGAERPALAYLRTDKEKRMARKCFFSGAKKCMRDNVWSHKVWYV
jgi:hypothetical protein